MDAKSAAKKFVDSIGDEKLSEIVSQFSEMQQDYISKEVALLERMKQDVATHEARRAEMWEKYRVMEWSDEKNELMETRSNLGAFIEFRESQILVQQNVVNAIQNGGSVVDIKDKIGKLHSKVADFRKVDSEQIIFDEDAILVSERPHYIPEVNEEKFASMGYLFDAIRIEKDTYILSASSFSDRRVHIKTDEFSLPEMRESYQGIVLVTLDQLVLSLDYYYTRAKASAKKAAQERTERGEAHYDSLSAEKRTQYMFHRHIYESMPAKTKKKISKEDFEKLDLEGRETYYKAFKKYGAKRLKSKLDNNTMWVSFHQMYQRYINPDAHPVNLQGVPQVGAKGGMNLRANPEISRYWHSFREMMDFKIKDIKIQRADLSESYEAAIETSFGESNTDTVLKDKYGILVKRQNGDKISPVEVSQIEDSWSEVQRIFGNLKPNALKYNMKVSHSGKRLIFASKAIGVFIPSMGTIGVSDKYGFNQFESTLSHEVGHFIDYLVGQLNGKRWATDDYEDTAGIIAFTFRNNMNKPKNQQTDYINATKECFARALQQYFGVVKYGDEASLAHSYKKLDETVTMYSADHFVNKENFTTKIKPLIEKFFEEQSDVFQTTVDLDGSDDIAPIGIKSEENLDLVIAGLKVLAKTEKSKEITELISSLESK